MDKDNLFLYSLLYFSKNKSSSNSFFKVDNAEKNEETTVKISVSPILLFKGICYISEITILVLLCALLTT